MQLILSNEVAKKLRIEVQGAADDFTPDLDTWRVGFVSVRKRSFFIISNEISLYTLITPHKKGLNGIFSKLKSFSGYKKSELSNVEYIKFQNRPIIGSMNNIKQIIEIMDDYTPEKNLEIYERLINNTPFKVLEDASPAKVHWAHKNKKPDVS